MSPHRLHLLRHAKAEPFSDTDAGRPLALRGREQATQVGELLAQSGTPLDLVLVSSAVRTRQTWQRVASRLDHEPQVRYLEEIYDATPREVLALLRGLSESVGSVLVVGHEPTMSALATTVAAEGGESGVLREEIRLGMPTATRAELTLEGAWSDLGRGGGRLVAIHRV
ncbi:SixA phosphatase family protein [Serinibacter salmoneus]|uniref:Phosphohistidine phosphatase n=1 Tax=Serinibacter salmoneus TaxID=556530 RepID=A0A2A9D1J0_9MICO|nr:histidine phosphatase family protein [Serinibacter salmoneus]PFG19812.1 phosphohistidine phosphatase [Serinibacter salmoneus]